ncbi:DUF6527 family protein [Dyella flava]|uniref:DUF6527 family protein n=1 Tax=Dyella flava TaxID=1920170 RepID=UPI0035E6130A
MIRLPIQLVEWLARCGILTRPNFLYSNVLETPSVDEVTSDLIYHEIREGYSKWLHLRCPVCGDHIQLESALPKPDWTVTVDWLRRPTISPSIWERDSCGAHFFVRRGYVVWCK